MTARISSDFFTGALNSVFTNTQNFVPSQVLSYRGSITPSPTVVPTMPISDTTAGSNSAGTTIIGSNSASGYWTLPSNGVSILSSPINVNTMSSGAIGSTSVPAETHIVRLLRAPMPVISVSFNHGILDLELSTIRSPAKGKGR